MKRDLDLIRDLLLRTEEMAPSEKLNTRLFETDQPLEVVAAHVELLIEARYVEGHVSKNGEGEYLKWFIHRIKMDGHDYLDSVRDPEVYRKTMIKLQKVGGSAGLEVVKELAKLTLRQTIGLDL